MKWWRRGGCDHTGRGSGRVVVVVVVVAAAMAVMAIR